MRKMKKFADGGSDKYKARYDRKVADIESDYEKAKGRKTGRAAEVAKAKYEQRMADAKDDLAKWTKSDRTATRAAESAAEKNLSMTRKFGARSSEGLVAKAESKLADKAPLSSVDTTGGKSKPSSFKEAFAAARKNPEAMNAGKFTWNGKSYSTAIAGEKKAAPKITRPAPKSTGAAPKVESKPTAKATTPAPAAKATTPAPAAKAKDPFAKDKTGNYVDTSSAGSRARLAGRFGISGGKPSGAYGALADIARKKDEEKAAKAKAEEANRKAKVPVTRLGADPYGFNKAKGGSVKKYKDGGPVMESKRKPIDMRRAILGSDKEIVGRANRTPHEPIPKKGPDKPKQKLGRMGEKGYAKGGKVMKKGADGIAKKGKTKGMMPKMACGGKGYAKGGSIDGIAMKGKTHCKGMK